MTATVLIALGALRVGIHRDDNVVAQWLLSNNKAEARPVGDRGPLRLEQMDAAGIDFQILSLFDPRGTGDDGHHTRGRLLPRRANDNLAETVRGTPAVQGPPPGHRTPPPPQPGWAYHRTGTGQGANQRARPRALPGRPYLRAAVRGRPGPERTDLPAPTTPHLAVMDAWRLARPRARRPAPGVVGFRRRDRHPRAAPDLLRACSTSSRACR